MLRMKILFAALLVAVMAGTVPSARATTSSPRIVASGSSAMWQTVALAAFNGGSCTTASVAVHPPCFHYTDNAKFNLNDSRPVSLGGTTNSDPGDLWIVWDSPTDTQVRNVWVYIKEDSVVGDRCFFASPTCKIAAPAGYVWATLGGKISSTLWGTDTVPPADVQSLFSGAGLSVNTAATDIRPEDGAWAECRVNSALGNGVPGFGDGLDGLGYNSGNPAGTCPQFGATLAQLVGSPILSGTSTATANVLAFNISGHDPFTNATIPAFSVIDVGAAPITFIVSKTAGLSGATAATDAKMQAIFSGDNCNASVLGQPSAKINVFLREPLSGTMNTTEASLLRRPVETTPLQKVLGKSQEKNVAAAKLASKPCVAGGGTRTRGIGTGEVVGDVKSAAGSGTDGIAYTFFSFGNVSSITGSSFGYLTLNGFNPIGLNTVTQELPSCTVPCSETSLWGSAGSSFPDLRAGHYTAWSLLRMVTTAGHKPDLSDLVTGSQKFVVDDTPDYIPAVSTTGTTGTDPGLKIFHTHYQQRDGNDNTIGLSPLNGTFVGGNPVGGDRGGDMGGCTITTTGITQTTKNNFIQSTPVACSKLRD